MREVKFNAIKIGELSVDFMKPAVTMHAKAAFVSTTTGNTHGWTTGGNWSTETFQRLQALREAMEADLESAHFEGSGDTTDGGTKAQPPNGLGEHFGSVPQA